MTNDEMNKKMEFIVEHQAKFTADIEIMREVQAQDGMLLRTVSDAVITVMGLVGTLTEAQGRADDRINSLADAQTHTDENIKLLAAAQAGTDERLNIFISVVEHYISGNGGSQSPA
jgi:hypothetical protein